MIFFPEPKGTLIQFLLSISKMITDSELQRSEDEEEAQKQ